MKTLLAAAALAFGAAGASASEPDLGLALGADEPPPPASPDPPAQESPDVGARLLWGAGFHGGMAVDQDFVIETYPFPGLGAYFRMGYQLNDLWGFGGELSAGTMIVDAYFRSALTVEITPDDAFTFAFGPTVRVDVLFGTGASTAGSEEDDDDDSANGSGLATSVGGTVRLDFHVAPSRTVTGRSAFTIGIVADLGGVPPGGAGSFIGGPGVAYGLYLTLGYAHY